VVIVNPGNPTHHVDRKFLADAFLKKTTRWDDGELIRPVDQLPDSPVRRKFSEDVVKRSVAAVRSYWQQVIFAGRDVPRPSSAATRTSFATCSSTPGRLLRVRERQRNGAKVVEVE